MRLPRVFTTASLLLAFSALLLAAPSYGAAGPAIENGKVVSLEYTLTDDKGGQIDTNKGGDPLVYTQGEKKILPGLEKAIAGMHRGDEKDVTLPPKEAYGEVDKNAFREIEKDKLPPDALKVGTLLTATAPTGDKIPVRVAEVKDKTAVIDFNHPMAGKTIKFHVKIIDVKNAEPAKPGAAAAEPGGAAPSTPQKVELE
jgi:FKBP-type peptidyl-prolyl cis-trans isomerase SlyD